MEKDKFKTVDEYILQFPEEVQGILCKLRKVIKEAAPEAEEKISYQIPTFYLYGNLVHFAAFKKHIGFYPAPSGMEAFKDELSIYKNAKGSIHFQINRQIPFELVKKIVRFRAKENIGKMNNQRKYNIL